MTETVVTSIEAVEGFKVAGIRCGLKKDGRLDFALVVSDRPCVAVGVFTTNMVKAAPVVVDQQILENNAESIRAVAVNTGCANACTGRKGVQDAHVTANWVAEALGIRQESVLLLSTGVIGTHLPMDKIRQGVADAKAALGNDWTAAANAIMTTDTRPKQIAVDVETASGARYRVAGIAKGAGMIAPNMATMLGVLVTDAKLSEPNAQTALRSVTDRSFNCIVVDGDMSTNDTVLMLANGASGVEVSSAEDLEQFERALRTVAEHLAHAIVRDGEGVTKFITVNVKHAPTPDAAKQIANTIATSPLVKTAFYGGDANWGRIIAAAGRAGVPLNPEHLRLWIAPGEEQSFTETSGAMQLFANGIAAEYDEPQALEIMKEPAISVVLDCGSGDGEACVWTCDLTHDYVSVNGHYRT